MADLAAIEPFVRQGEHLDRASQLVVRGWPLTVERLLRNADATRRRYLRSELPFLAISAEVTVAGWELDAILAGPRLRTRRSDAAAPVGGLLDAGFELLATFAAPHYSIVLPSYTDEAAQGLLVALGDAHQNPYHERRRA